MTVAPANVPDYNFAKDLKPELPDKPLPNSWPSEQWDKNVYSFVEWGTMLCLGEWAGVSVSGFLESLLCANNFGDLEHTELIVLPRGEHLPTVTMAPTWMSLKQGHSVWTCSYGTSRSGCTSGCSGGCLGRRQQSSASTSWSPRQIGPALRWRCYP